MPDTPQSKNATTDLTPAAPANAAPASDAAVTPNPVKPVPAAELSPEEQMERFARELKENDWGHQPC